MFKKFRQKSLTIIAGLSVIFTYFLSGCVPIFGQRGVMAHGSMGNWRVGWSGFLFIIIIIVFLFFLLVYIISRQKNINRVEEKEVLQRRSNAADVLKERNKRQKS